MTSEQPENSATPCHHFVLYFMCRIRVQATVQTSWLASSMDNSSGSESESQIRVLVAAALGLDVSAISDVHVQAALHGEHTLNVSAPLPIGQPSDAAGTNSPQASSASSSETQARASNRTTGDSESEPPLVTFTVTPGGPLARPASSSTTACGSAHVGPGIRTLGIATEELLGALLNSNATSWLSVTGILRLPGTWHCYYHSTVVLLCTTSSL